MDFLLKSSQKRTQQCKITKKSPQKSKFTQKGTHTNNFAQKSELNQKRIVFVFSKKCVFFSGFESQKLKVRQLTVHS